jgi:DNA-directed RNA polymerase subunit RPC12/RpoP
MIRAEISRADAKLMPSMNGFDLADCVQHLTCALILSRANRDYGFWSEEMREKTTLTLYRCAECGEVFNMEEDVLEHEIGHRGKIQIYPCEECGRLFGSMGELSEHELTHAGIG